MAEALVADDLVKLLAWFSPSLPVGAYSYSHGLEAAVEEGLVTCASSLGDYVETALRFGTGRNDAVLLAAAYGAARSDDAEARVLEIAVIAAAMRGTSELALESTAQGAAMLKVLREVWPAVSLDLLDTITENSGIQPTHPVVAGVAAAGHGLALPAVLTAYLHAFVANLVSAGVRLVPLGQTDGQRVTAAIEPAVRDVAAEAAAGSIDDLGTATPMIDLLSMAHETQYTRLFRS